MTAYAYRIDCEPTGKSYIGITMTPVERRWYLHRHGARTGKNPGSRLYAAIRKHGEHAFTVRTIVVCPDWEYACDLEKKLIATYDTYANGYNATEGGEGTVGYSPSEEYRAEKSRFFKAIPRTPEWCAAISAAKKGKKLPRHVHEANAASKRGVPQTEEHKAKRSAALKGKKQDPEVAARRLKAMRDALAQRKLVRKIFGEE